MSQSFEWRYSGLANQQRYQEDYYTRSIHEREQVLRQREADIAKMHEMMRQQYHQMQKQAMPTPIPPELDPQHFVTQALMILFGDHWKIINEELALLDKQRS